MANVLLISFLLATQLVAALNQCRNCTSNSDCTKCKLLGDVPHSFFANTGSVQYTCVANFCKLTVASVPLGIAEACNQPAIENCCVPSGNTTVDLINCQRKTCKAATGCDQRGFCTYNSTDVYEGCCGADGDCPVTPNVPVSTDLEIACMTPICSATNCTYQVPSGCCASVADCGSVSEPNSVVCVQDPAALDRKKCLVVTDVAKACSSSGDCGGDSQPCRNNFCTSSTCGTSPKSPDNPPLGCCPDDSTLTSCVGDVCLVPIGCVDTPTDYGNGVTSPPSYECIFDDLTTRGCCTEPEQCAALSQRSTCLTATCDTNTNRCELNVPKASGPCCYSSDQCGIANEANMCKYFQCNGPASDLIDAADAFECAEVQIDGCSVNNPPTNGLTPATSYSHQLDCTWSCLDFDANTINTVIAFTNDLASGRPIYGFDVELIMNNAAGKDFVLSSVMNGKPSSSDPNRVVANGLFVANAPVTVPAGQFAVRFVSQDYFFVSPGETITFNFQTLFNPDPAVTLFTFQYKFHLYEPCTQYYVGQVGCDAADVLLNPKKRLPRDPVTTIEFFGSFGSSCSAQCPGVVVPTPAPPPGVPTPLPTVTPAPTPPPVTLPISGSSGPDRTVQLEVLGCQYDCDASSERFPNAFRFRLTETNTYVVQVMSSIKYEFELVLEPYTFDDISPAGTQFDYDITNAVPDNLATTPSSIVGDKITFTPSPVGINPGNSQTFDVVFFRSVNSGGSTLTDGTLKWKAYLPTFLCDNIQIVRGFCNSGQFGLTIAPILSASVGLTFGSDITDCAPDACGVRPFVPFAASKRFGQLDCQWDCTNDAEIAGRNRYSIEFCFNNTNPPLSGSMWIRGATVFLREVVTLPDSSVTPGADIPPAQIFDAKITFDNDPTVDAIYDIDLAGWHADLPNDELLRVSPQSERCLRFDFYRSPLFVNPAPIFFTYSLTAFRPCSMPDIESGQCAPNRIDDAAATGLIRQSTATVGEVALQQCSESCDAGTWPAGLVGGRVFFDADGDGSFTSGDSFLSGVQVAAVRSSAQTTISSVATDINGYYFFNETALFATTGLAFFRLDPATIPVGLQLTVLGNTNPFYDNVFFGNPPRSVDFALHTSLGLYLAGLRPKAACERNFTGPFDPVGTTLLRALGTTCSNCVVGPNKPALSCTAAKCAGAGMHRVLVVDYGMSNIGTKNLSSSTVRIEFDQALANVDDSHLLCADMRAESVSPGVVATSDNPAKLAGPNAVPAYAEFGWTTWPVGVNSLKFSVRIAFCASNANFLYNLTATIKSRECTALLQGWSSCADGKADDDYRQCYNELAPAPLPACSGTCAPTPAPTTLPGSPTPAPTFGPPGASTPIDFFLDSFEEKQQCVTKALIREQPCNDIGNAIANCTAADVRRVVVFRFLVLLKPLAESGEPGTALVTIRRNMPRATAFCQRFNPEIRVEVERGGDPVNNTLAIVTYSTVDQTEQFLKLKFGFLRFDDPTTIISLDVRSIECLSASTQLNYTASMRLVTLGCTDAAACTKTSQLTSHTVGLACDEPVDEPAFADEHGGGRHIEEQFEEFEGEGSADHDAGITAIILSVVFAIVLCLVCCFVCIPMLLRRFSVQRNRAQRDPTAAPPKQVEFSTARSRMPASAQTINRIRAGIRK